MRKILTSLICIGLSASVFAAPRLRVLTPSSIGSARSASVAGTGGTAVKKTAATNSASSRLSTSSFLNNRGKLGTSTSKTPSTGGNSGGGNPGDNVDLSNYATISQIEDLESQISALEGQITSGDSYTKQEVDDIIDNLTLNGVQGPQGETGPAGPQGASGASAYEVAVANGFVGTEAEWLAGLGGNSVIENGGASDGSYIIDVDGGNVTYTPIDVTGDVFTE